VVKGKKEQGGGRRGKKRELDLGSIWYMGGVLLDGRENEKVQKAGGGGKKGKRLLSNWGSVVRAV